MEEPNANTAAKAEPKRVLNRVVLEATVNGLLEGETSKACKLEVLETEGYEDNTAEADDTCDEINDCGDKAEDEPDDIADSSHIGCSFGGFRIVLSTS